MSFINGLFKFYAYLFHLALSTFLIGIAILAKMSHQPLHLEMVPFDQQEMISRVSLLSLIGFICIFLALVRIFEFVFPLWSLAVVVLAGLGILFHFVFLQRNRRIGVGPVADSGRHIRAIWLGISSVSATQAALVTASGLSGNIPGGHKAQYPRAELTRRS